LDVVHATFVLSWILNEAVNNLYIREEDLRRLIETGKWGLLLLWFAAVAADTAVLDFKTDWWCGTSKRKPGGL
jgi:hypothetical protein